MYEIHFARGVVQDLRKVAAYHRRRILDAIEGQLAHEPTKPTRNRKLLVKLVPPWTTDAPVWELRVGTHRVFYDVDLEELVVSVRAILAKLPGKRTEEIL